jgi:molybdopterin synthase sulfur carrier subunit
VAITVEVSSALRAVTGGRDRIEVGGSPSTLGDALEALWVVCPGLRDRVVTEQREIREHVNVFVGVENVRYTGGLETPLADGAEISIFQAVSGGSV